MTETPPTPDTPPEQSAIAQHLTSRANAPDSEHEVTQRDDDEHTTSTRREHDEQHDDDEGGNDDELRQTFDRDYVERLRTKSAGYRLRAKEAESDRANLQRQLFTERLQRLDLVVDVEAVPYDPALLDDEAALVDHVEALLESKPYLRKRKVAGDIGQHSAGDNPQSVSLLSMMKQNS